MAYDKPIEIKVISQNTKGTEVNAVKLLDTIEKQLKTVLKEGDLFKSPKASVDYNTHNVTKSFFVQRDAEKIVRDIINLKKDIFYKAPSITSNEAKTRKYKVDVEGDRALASLRANAASHGGRTYGNQHGTYIEVPAYSGVRSSVASKAENITKEQRNKANEEAERFLNKEQRETKLLEEAKLAAIEKEKEAQKKKQGKTADKWNKLTKAQEKSVQDEIDAYFAAEEKSKVVEATKAEADAQNEKVKRAKAESAMNNKWQKLLYKRDADVAAEEAKKAAEEEKVKKEVAKFFKTEDDSAAALKARQEAKESAIEAREKEAHARELKRREASMFRLITNKEEKEAKDAKREEEKEAKDAKREEEKQEKQREKEAEKEDRQKEAEQKQRSVALMSKLAISVLLLKKLISLVENITTSVIEQGQKSFETSLTAQRLNLSPDILLKLEYAGISKGIGSAPINAMLSLQDSFGATLLAAKNISKLDNVMSIIGDDVEKLILNGVVGTNPLGMKTMLMDKFLGAYHAKSNGLGGTTKTKEASLASLITLATEAFGDDFAVEFNRAAKDGATDYSAWLMDSIPVSTPSYNLITASGENYEEYTAALTEFKAAMNNLKLQLSPVLDKLTVVLEKLTGWIMKLTGDKGGVAQLSEKNYEQAKASYARDLAQKEETWKVRTEYAARNEKAFEGGFDAAFKAPTEFLDNGTVPEHLKNDEKGLKEFFAIVLAASLERQLDENLRKSGKVKEEYESNKLDYLEGKKTLTFADTELSYTMAKAEINYEAAAHKYYSSKLEDETPKTNEELAKEVFSFYDADLYTTNNKRIAELQAWIQEESKKEPEKNPFAIAFGTVAGFFTDEPVTIEGAQKKIDKITKANLSYEKQLEEYRESVGAGSGTTINSDMVKELMEAGIREFVVQTIFSGQLPDGFSYIPKPVENQSGKLYIQLLDADGKEKGEAVEVPAFLASAFNETMQFSLQGN